MRAMISEYLKSDDSMRALYQVGDEFVPASYYPPSRWHEGDGIVVFFDDPRRGMSSMQFVIEDERIGGLSFENMSVSAFRQRVAEVLGDGQ